MADMKRVGVLGCGLMGSGIAQVAASAGYETIVRDVSKELLDRGRAGIEKSVTADFFTAYDEDGGLLVGLAPRS